MTGLVTVDIAGTQQLPRATTISFTEVSIPRWISSAADGTSIMTVGSLVSVAPPAAWLQHLPAASDDSRHKPSVYLTARAGVGRLMLTYGRCRSERSMAASAAPYATVEAMAAP